MIRKLIRQILEETIGDFNYNKTFNPPSPVMSTCRRAMEEYGSNLKSAVELSKGRPHTHKEVKRLRDWFVKNAPLKSDPEIMKAWKLHGGDEGQKWSEKVMSNFHDSSLSRKDTLRKAGGAGDKKGMGIFDTRVMDTNKGRNNIR